MKFQIQKKTLVEAIDKMHEVATKGIKTDFKLAFRIRIEAVGKDAIVSATNGHLFASCTVPCESVEEVGSVVVDASVGRENFRALGGHRADGHKIEVKLTDKSLNIRDIDCKNRRWARMQTVSQDHSFTIKQKKGSSYTMPSTDLVPSLLSISKYHAPTQYDPMYSMLCVHFLTDETRYICGDGMRFVVQCCPNRTDIEVEDQDKGDKWVIPADQASIIANVVSFPDVTDVTLTFPDKKSCIVKAGNVLMHLKGIPELDYIQYDLHSFRFDEAKAVIYVSCEDMLDALASTRASRDKEMEKEGDFHKCELHAEEDGMLGFKVSQGKYQSEFECPMEFYKGSVDKFDAIYSWLFLNDTATATSHEYIRLFAIDPEGIMIAEPLDIMPTDDKGEFEADERVSIKCPARKMDDSDKYAPRLIFFFAAVSEEEEDG